MPCIWQKNRQDHSLQRLPWHISHPDQTSNVYYMTRICSNHWLAFCCHCAALHWLLVATHRSHGNVNTTRRSSRHVTIFTRSTNIELCTTSIYSKLCSQIWVSSSIEPKVWRFSLRRKCYWVKRLRAGLPQPNLWLATWECSLGSSRQSSRLLM